MNTIERIIHNDIVMAVIIYSNHEQDGIQFLTPSEYSLQLGQITRPKGYQFLPHIHKPVCRNTIGTQEILFIRSGEIRIDFYSSEQVFLESRKLSAGDIILLVGGGHSIEVLKKAVIVEVKNGPYIEGADKSKFEGKRGKK